MMSISFIKSVSIKFCMVIVLCLGLMSKLLMAESSDKSDPVMGMEQLEAEILKLNRELFILEEDLLYPPETQISVFLSWDGGQFFDLDAIELKIDGHTVASHLYTQRQREALKKGGLQQLYLGNLKSGKHEITAVMTGLDKERGNDIRPMRHATTLDIEKTDTALRLELSIEDDPGLQQPKLALVEWAE